jgi:hypothetical protein
MDGLTLLRHARDAGLRVEAAGDKLLIRGPKGAEPLVKLLAKYKADVLEALGAGATPPNRSNVGPQSPWFERAISVAEGEPGMELPCAARRGRVQELDGAFLHFCGVCGRFGAFGYGVRLRTGETGRWYCAAHRPLKHGLG